MLLVSRRYSIYKINAGNPVSTDNVFDLEVDVPSGVDGNAQAMFLYVRGYKKKHLIYPIATNLSIQSQLSYLSNRNYPISPIATILSLQSQLTYLSNRN